MTTQDAVHFMMTGGTIDSYWDGFVDTVIPLPHSIIERYLTAIKIERPLLFTEICMEDSRTVTNDHRRALVNEIEQSPSTKVVVTHGNFTIRESALYVEDRLRVDNKVVVFTGASIPLENMTLSDGGFNLGYAFAQVDVLAPGIYIAVGGKVHKPADEIPYLDSKLYVSRLNS